MKSRTPLLLPSPLWRLVLLLLLWTNVRDYNSPSLYLSLSKFIGKFVGKMLENVNSIRNILYTSSSFNRTTRNVTRGNFFPIVIDLERSIARIKSRDFPLSTWTYPNLLWEGNGRWTPRELRAERPWLLVLWPVIYRCESH